MSNDLDIGEQLDQQRQALEAQSGSNLMEFLELSDIRDGMAMLNEDGSISYIAGTPIDDQEYNIALQTGKIEIENQIIPQVVTMLIGTLGPITKAANQPSMDILADLNHKISSPDTLGMG